MKTYDFSHARELLHDSKDLLYTMKVWGNALLDTFAESKDEGIQKDLSSLRAELVKVEALKQKIDDFHRKSTPEEEAKRYARRHKKYLKEIEEAAVQERNRIPTPAEDPDSLEYKHNTTL